MLDQSPNPSVAVVMPNHERVETAIAAIRSVMEQDYRGRINIYLVYQRRSDAQRLIDVLPDRVRVIPFSGSPSVNPIAAKRNVGLRESDEDLVAFLDDDDVWHPRKVSAQVGALCATRGALACATAPVAFVGVPTWPDASRSVGARVLSRSDVLRASTIITSSMMVSGDLARNLSFDERSAWTGVEDFHLWNRVQEHGPIVHLDAPLVGIRLAATTMSRLSRSRQHAKTLGVLAEFAGVRGRDRSLLVAAARRSATTALSGRGSVDPEADAMLDGILDGRLFGAIDPLVCAAIRRVWRSRHVAPSIMRVRDRIRAQRVIS